jgi:multidrug efflux pump subunit AcrA (membrane-fusion protein)
MHNPKRNSQRKLALIGIISLLAAALILSGCSSSEATQPAVVEAAPTGVIAQGHLEPLSYQDVAFTVPGQVVEVLVAEGDSVEAGQVLARLSGKELRQADLARARQELLAAQQALTNLQANPELIKAQAQAAVAQAELAVQKAQDTLDELNKKSSPDPLEVAQAEAQLALAQAQFEKAKSDAETLKDGVDPSLLEAAQARLDSAQAAVTSAETSLAALELRAPLAGTVVSLNLKPGAFITAGQPALTLADFSGWIVKTDDLTELEVVQIKLAQTVSITLDALPGQPITGTVIAINPRYEERRGDVTYTVTIALNNPADAARWGMTGQVVFSED